MNFLVTHQFYKKKKNSSTVTMLLQIIILDDKKDKRENDHIIMLELVKYNSQTKIGELGEFIH